jgi:ABC-type glycerol-3-phosphate transport system substrate-binding protein
LDKDARAVFEYALAHPTPPENPLNRPLQQAIRQIIKGESSVEEALATAQAEALELQAQLAAATPVAPQPVAPPEPTPAGAETTLAFAPALSSDMALYRDLATVFHESHPEIMVEVVAAPYDLAERATASDCFGGSFPIQYAEVRQYIHSLGPLMETDQTLDLADFYPGLLEPLQRDGELWGLPYQTDALLVYYNRARFAGAGIATPEPGWSFDDFLDAAVALSDGDRYGFTTREGVYGNLIFALERQGARLLDRSHEPPTPTFDDPTVVTALANYAEAAHRHPLSPATPSTQSGWPDGMMWGGHPAGVESGQAAMWIDYTGNQTGAPPLSFEVGAAPLPSGSEASTELNVDAYYVSAHTAEPQACWKWLAFLSGRIKVVQLLPARRSVAASPEWQALAGETILPAYQATLEYKDTSILRLRWETYWLTYTYPWLDEAFQATVAGDDAGRALAEVQRKVKMYIECLEREDGLSNPELLKACIQEVDPNYPATLPYQ